MNIDERLEKLAERHQALAESVEFFTHTVHEPGGRIDQILTIVESQATTTQATLEMIRNHEDRIRGLEGLQ